MSQPPDPIPEHTRLQRLEEALGFTEHEQERLGTQVVRLQQQVQALSQRVVQLEASLERATSRSHHLNDQNDQGDTNP